MPTASYAIVRIERVVDRELCPAKSSVIIVGSIMCRILSSVISDEAVLKTDTKFVSESASLLLSKKLSSPSIMPESQNWSRDASNC